MNEELLQNEDAYYKLAEEKATKYYKALYAQVIDKSYIETLTIDFKSWEKEHIRRRSLFSLLSRRNEKQDSKTYYSYIKWLNVTGKLDRYLERSISYIFMRDLGKDLGTPATQERITRAVNKLKHHLISAIASEKNESYSIASLYRFAQKERLESTMIWLMSKLKTVASRLPEGMDAEDAQRKLIKIIAGVLMHELEEMDEGTSSQKRTQKLETAIRLGYAYGITYPFIDDLLDANVLSHDEKKQYSTFIRSTLLTGSVRELGYWTGTNKDLMIYIHSELRDAFEYITACQSPESRNHFYEQAYVFFQSQEVDRDKNLANSHYSNEEIYIPSILKSASSRLIVRSLINAPEDEDIDSRTFYYGLYNQLADDFTDMFDDLKEERVTPYTYYLKYSTVRNDLINPFELYWAVISHLIHHVYHSDDMTREVILDRAINGLKRCLERLGASKYYEIMQLFTGQMPSFNSLIQHMVHKAVDVDFFDKLLRDHVITILRNEKMEREQFFETVETVRFQINSTLAIPKHSSSLDLQEPITDAANYSLEGDGKRLRPIMTWMMAVNEYGFDQEAVVPLLKSLEYMHTASLIYDDLPSQDNASIRRGRPTLHNIYNVATAELTGLFLTQKAVEEQASLHQFDAKSVLRLIQYSTRRTADMCKGQLMDLDSKGKRLTLEELNIMCFYKTGIGFEASLVMPAILANTNDTEIKALKAFAHHAGIAFQIKDDLLDVEGDVLLLGKTPGKDGENNNSTFVSILGVEGAKKAMWDHYCSAIEALQKVPRRTAFLKHVMNYIVNRDH
ncbi:polyprenyl synthetase family protein [Anaerobacillus sp. MEB173]|uniref:polyprenyl synthetase family protein n=1 Tax=Anaerobacillus sp. MEB173 TaxID=3383345 RepID=UPI003F8DD2C9